MKPLIEFLKEASQNQAEYKFSWLSFDEDEWYRESEKSGDALEKIDFCTVETTSFHKCKDMKTAIKLATKQLEKMNTVYYAITVESPDGDIQTVTREDDGESDKKYEMMDLFLNTDILEWIKNGSFSVKQLQDAVNDLMKNNEDSYYEVKNNKGNYCSLFDPGDYDRPYNIKDDKQAHTYALRRMKRNKDIDAISISSGEPGISMDFIEIVMSDRFLASIKSGRI